jgi:hypothetical protein
MNEMNMDIQSKEWNKSIFFDWLIDCMLSFDDTENQEEIDESFLIQLTLNIFQRVLKEKKTMELDQVELYGFVSFGIALKYLSEDGEMRDFLHKEIYEKISLRKLILTEIDVLRIIDYKIPLQEYELELDDVFIEVANFMNLLYFK